MSEPDLRNDEQIEDLELNGLRIIQRRGSFRFGMDAVLLADFARAKRRDAVCDLGTGTGVLPLLMYGRQPFLRADALELQPDMADMAARSVLLNGLENVIRVQCGDIRSVRALYPHGAHTLVVCNPPYHRADSAPEGMAQGEYLSRFDARCTLHDMCDAAAWLLNNGGRLCVCVQTQRLAELMADMHACGIEPKRLCMVASYIKKAPYLALVEGVLGAKPGLSVEPLLVAYERPGVFTERMRAIYHLDA